MINWIRFGLLFVGKARDKVSFNIKCVPVVCTSFVYRVKSFATCYPNGPRPWPACQRREDFNRTFFFRVTQLFPLFSIDEKKQRNDWTKGEKINVCGIFKFDVWRNFFSFVINHLCTLTVLALCARTLTTSLLYSFYSVVFTLIIRPFLQVMFIKFCSAFFSRIYHLSYVISITS